MRATLTDAEYEINDCIFSVESDIEEIEAKKAEADEFYEKLKEEWYSFVEDIKQMDAEYAIEEPKGLLKYALLVLEIKNISIGVLAFQVRQAYNIFLKYQNLADEVFNDLGICAECKDKWKHANVNYECVKLGLLGEQIAIAMSVVKEIKDLNYKINKQKRDALEMIKDSLEDLKADYFGILQAKNRLQNGVDVEEFKKIFHQKHER